MKHTAIVQKSLKRNQGHNTKSYKQFAGKIKVYREQV